MKKQIKINFKIDYQKSDLEKGLEDVLKNHNIKLSGPKFIDECNSGENTYTQRNAKITDKLTLDYRRDVPIYDALNFGQAISTAEWIFLNVNDKSNGYAFNLDCNKKYLDTCDTDFSVNAIAPNYKGKLEDKYTVDKNGDCVNIKITKDKFLQELNTILKDYISTKGVKLK